MKSRKIVSSGDDALILDDVPLRLPSSDAPPFRNVRGRHMAVRQ